jgi:hypothetical protein
MRMNWATVARGQPRGRNFAGAAYGVVGEVGPAERLHNARGCCALAANGHPAADRQGLSEKGYVEGRNASTRCANVSGDWPLRNPMTGISRCCARDARGHAITALPMSVMNSRRFTSRAPVLRPKHSTGRCGGRLLRCGISIRPMTAMGQERRIGAVRNISAFPPRLDVGADIFIRPAVPSARR